MLDWVLACIAGDDVFFLRLTGIGLGEDVILG